MPIVPAVVCQAFAIELYLKALLTLEKGKATGHKLSDLFGELSAEMQSKVWTSLSLSEIDFKHRLKADSSAFVEWRYVFESDSAKADLGFLTKLSNVLKVICESAVKATSSD